MHRRLWLIFTALLYPSVALAHSIPEWFGLLIFGVPIIGIIGAVIGFGSGSKHGRWLGSVSLISIVVGAMSLYRIQYSIPAALIAMPINAVALVLYCAVNVYKSYARRRA